MKKKVQALVIGASLAAAMPAGAEDSGAVFAAPMAALQAAVRISNAKAGPAIVSDRTTPVSVALNAGTVKCSAADYSAPMLKVLIPALADLTVLNHRNDGEGAPCVAAGRCSEVRPEDVLRGGEGADRINVRVVLRKETSIQGLVCRVSLIETIETTIRGVAFRHERVQEVAERLASDCR
ncbi:MAG: hypothetical protein HY403_07710 [Elusimicrobia bacterium]|nr:hypothetical protein [Elusimicrobiota bacterium]